MQPLSSLSCTTNTTNRRAAILSTGIYLHMVPTRHCPCDITRCRTTWAQPEFLKKSVIVDVLINFSVVYSPCFNDLHPLRVRHQRCWSTWQFCWRICVVYCWDVEISTRKCLQCHRCAKNSPSVFLLEDVGCNPATRHWSCRGIYRWVRVWASIGHISHHLINRNNAVHVCAPICSLLSAQLIEGLHC